MLFCDQWQKNFQERVAIHKGERKIIMITNEFAKKYTLTSLLFVFLITPLSPVYSDHCLAAESSQRDMVSITISAAGDCTFGSDRSSPASVNFYSVYRRKKDPGYFFKRVKKIFAKDDMTLVNFEGTLTKRDTRAPKRFAFKGSPGYVKILKKGSVEAVSFANNHCRDFGEGSYRDTIHYLDQAGVTYSSYSKVSVYKIRGKKIGMIAVNGLENISSVKALIQKGMKKLKKRKADIRIVSMHAGIEHNYTVSTAQKSIARYAVDQGASLVLGHHPHNLQGIERYKGVYIAYSLGNFCFGGNTNPSDKDTMIFQQTFVFHKDKLKRKKSRVKIIPCSISSVSGINNYQPAPAKGKKKARILRKLDRMCQPMGLTLRDKKRKLTDTLYTKKKKGTHP